MVMFGYAAKAEKKFVDSKINEVTVYPMGAMINRTATVSMAKGSQLIVLDNLTQAIDPNTIQVGGTGSFEILSVKFELFYPYAKSKPKGIERIEDSLKNYRDQRFLLEGENNALDQERQMILANQKLSGNNSSVSVEQINAMATYYRSRLANIQKEKLRNQNERIVINNEEKRLNSTLAGMNQYKYEQVGRISLEINANATTQATFKFSYFTHLAGWKPKYNIKAYSESDELNVDYHAMVTQTTGVDWNKLDLILSTSRPTYNNQKPEIDPWYLDFVQQLKIRGSMSNEYYTEGLTKMKLEEIEVSQKMGNRVDSDDEYKSAPSASYTWGEELVNALNTSYKISSKYSVPSNASNKQVFIKSIDIPASFNHYSVPSKEKESFITASIADWGSYDLVPGSATLFYNNTYVGKSYIYSNTTDDTLQISLGRDQGVILTQKKVKDLCSHKRIGSNIKKNFVYEISTKNTHKETITIHIYDRVPVSKKNEIEVNLGDLSGAEINKETGILKWTKTVDPGQSVTLRFDYEVKYPKDKPINL
ncbi:MAG: hypothetical protein ACI8SA_002080 [Dokdonia sp.]|jgi:uncharacterized protein (TIGR02231 family)